VEFWLPTLWDNGLYLGIIPEKKDI